MGKNSPLTTTQWLIDDDCIRHVEAMSVLFILTDYMDLLYGLTAGTQGGEEVL